MSSDLKISNICQKIYSGGTPSTSNRSFYEGGTIPWLKTKEVNFKKIYSTETKITELGLNNSSAKLVPVNSVIIAMYGETAGKVAINKIPLTTNQACCNLIVNPSKANFRFVYFYLLSIYKELLGMRVGGAQQNLSATLIKEIPFPKISLSKQNKIAELLGNIEDLIEAAQHQNTALEAIAQRLFRSWFVNFDPVHAKAAGKEPEAMSAELAVLFPGEFEDSELGPIPKGWSVTTFGDAFDIKGGATPSTSEPLYWDGGTHAWATPKDMSSLASKVMYRTERQITAAGVAKISSKALPAGTVLMSSRAPVGYLAIAKAPISINQGFIAIPPTQGIPASFTVELLAQKMPDIKANAGGTTFAEISKTQFRPIKWTRPSDKVLEAFGKLVEPLYAQVHGNCLLVDSLASLRDLLLPRLISGKLSLEEAQQVVEEATAA